MLFDIPSRLDPLGKVRVQHFAIVEAMLKWCNSTR